MAKDKRDNGSGTIYQRDNGTWQAKIYLGRKADGSPKFKYFSGKTQAEVKRKIREYNFSGSELEKKTITVGEYITNWLMIFKKGTIKDSSFDALERTIRNQIIPNIGDIQFQQLTCEDIQKLLTTLKDRDGYSHSVIKKVYDCLNAVTRHALVKKDILEDPMLLVNMPDKQLFEKKEIRFFDRKECALIIEECGRLYKTGKPVYVYADAYILMLNTGIRMGEAIGLEKRDWDREAKTLHIQRNVQSVQKRAEDGTRVVGKRLVCNTTKTYSGDRYLPLNKLATEALERLCSAHPESKYIICDSNGNGIPPERLERTFYYLLKNAKLEKCGTHSLRHTFASMLFAEQVDIKRISKLMGHANIQITIDTYVHLFEKIDHSSVAQLDNVFCKTQNKNQEQIDETTKDNRAGEVFVA